MASNTITSDYISGRKQINTSKERRKGNGKELILRGCTGNNLKNVTVHFPLGKMIGITGVSGSGKSTLINETLYPILNAHFFNAVKKPMPYAIFVLSCGEKKSTEGGDATKGNNTAESNVIKI